MKSFSLAPLVSKTSGAFLKGCSFRKLAETHRVTPVGGVCLAISWLHACLVLDEKTQLRVVREDALCERGGKSF